MIFLFCSWTTKSEELRFEHYNDEQGLFHNSIRAILQDSTGYIWLGTFGGVNRFNGYDFEGFSGEIDNPNYLQDDDITQLVIDDDHDLWIGTSNGLTKYHIPTSTFTTFHPGSSNDQLVGNKIRSLCIDDQNRIWIGTKENGICYYNQRKDIFVPVKIEGVQYVRSIIQTQDKTIWVGTFKQGVYAFQLDENDDVKNLKHYNLNVTLNRGSIDPDVFFIYEDHKFDVFAGTREGLFKKNKFKDEFEPLVQKNTSPDFFRCITQGPNGRYWLGTLNGLLVCDLLEDISINKFERHLNDLSNPVSLVNNYVTSLFFDKSGVLWIGTENGLDKYDPFRNQFKSIRSQNFAKDLSLDVSSYGKTCDNHLLIGTHSNGLWLLKNKALIQVSSKEKRVASIYSPDGIEFYCGLWDGKVLKYDYLTSGKEIIDVGIDDSPVFSMLKISSSKLIIGSHFKGVVEYDLLSKKHVTIKPDVINLQGINKIIQDDSGIIWFATPFGAFRYKRDSNELKNYAYIEGSNIGLSNSEIKDVIIDDEGKLWAATRRGLNYYDPEIDDFVKMDQPAELKDIWITDMAVDSLGKIWLNINYNQIASFNPWNKELKFFLVKTGMRSTIYNKRGFLYFNHSRIYLGGENGIVYFSPAGIYENTYAPEPIIDKFIVHNKEVIIGEKINGQVILNKNFNYSKQVELEYENRDFSIFFSSPSYVNEKLNQYQYKLKGCDKEWVSAGGGQRSVQYANLRPGNYEFSIKARNNNGYWSKESEYKIKILPPFWYTYKAFIIYFLLFFVLFYQIRRIIIFRVKMKQDLLFEKVKREKDEKLNEEKLRFFTNISHELKTPLTLILGPAQQLRELKNVEIGILKKYNLIYANASRLLELVNQIIDFRKAEQGKIKLKVSEIEIVHYTYELFESFQLMASNKQLKYSFECKHERMNAWIDANQYERMIFNLLSNAFKYTQQGEVTVYLDINEDNETHYLNISISDTGVGIPKDRHEKIFNRFYQVEEQLKYNTGSGIGLSFVKSLVTIHHGKIWFESEADKGSVFHIQLPINKKFYQSDEIFEYKVNASIPKISSEELKKNDELPLENKVQVLIIEDNEELRKYIVDILADEYHTFEACDGVEGLVVAKKIKPAIVVSDVMMERMDGFGFCNQLKNDDEISHIPVILLTALAEIENQKKGFKIGADAYISKPFDPSLLKIRILNILENRRKLKERYLTEPDLNLDQLSYSQADDEFIQKINSFIEENIMSSKLNKELLCSEFGISSSKLYRKIKELTDLSPNEMIRTVRLKKAFILLKNKDNNVSEVAYEVGFSDPFYFSRCFRKQFGYPPSKVLDENNKTH
ncbi:hybrid sensor histidine kinase/response regulator transcription factor [Saccharicrinis sp. GN24d3]|uniref:hybrid sensor histidine kinase/response regulator transcription factor n=1 Tax=Saccharicrinis sp. GN24d3 TaxID=3458416 RepID=UPI004036A49A